jgi:dTDP-4-amino-4,6-dideoxygalactose transaminase
LIEDAAHAAGVAEAGSFGAAAAFSFYGNKNMTTAEGGMVIASDKHLRERIRQMRGHGLTTGTFQRHAGATPTYDVTMLGYNYRMDELRAAMGLVQLRRLDAWNAKRRALTESYRKLLSERVPEVEVPFRGGGNSAHHIMPILLPKGTNRAQVVDAMRAAGIQTTIHYPAAHSLSLYRNLFPFVHLPLTEEYAKRELTLPLHPRLEEGHLDTITRSLASSLAGDRRRSA